MLYIVQRAFLSSYIIMPDDMLPVQIILTDQPCGEMYKLSVSRLSKTTAVIKMTVFNRN